MPTLLLRFPARRYHATPFGHHVNEGLIEWPPSPWRLLRALLSTGYTRLGWQGPMHDPCASSPPEVARSLIGKLASVLPDYALPTAIGAHSRHYMPVGELKDGRERTTMVFDTWAQVEHGELAVTWRVALDPDELRLLASLADSLGYLGRSESWVCARLVDQPDVDANCRPCADRDAPGPGWEQVSVLAAEPAYDDWRRHQVEAALSELPRIALPDKKKLTQKDRKPSEQRGAERANAAAPYPEHLIACLQADTTWLREYGWSQPPGSRRVLYWRRSDALRAPSCVVRDAPAGASALPFVLLSLSTASGNNHALPRIERTLPQGEMLHRQAVAARTRLAPGTHSRVLTGCDETGRALNWAHRHAHMLSLDLDGDGHIDHLLVWAPEGLDALDQRALRLVRGTYTKGGVGELRLAWSAAGGHQEMRRLPSPYGDNLARTLGSARVWISATPFVAPRHLKVRGVNSLEGQVRHELARRGLPQPQTVQLLDPQQDDGARRLRHHVRVRRDGPAPAVNMGFALRLVFAEAVAGPLCLGYASHFGGGRFECNIDDASRGA